MDKQINTDEIFEHHLEETVALFMDRYARDLAQQLQAPQEEQPYPEELDNRCLKLIHQAKTSKSRDSFGTATQKALQRVAIIFVAILSFVSILFVSVDAFRAPSKCFSFEESNGHWLVSGLNERPGVVLNKEFDTDPLADFVPEGYSFDMIDGDLYSHYATYYVRYTNDEGKFIYLHTYGGGGNTTFDAENAQYSRQHTIGDYDGIVVEKNGDTRILWVSDEANRVYIFFMADTPKDDAIAVAEKLSKLLTND